MCERRVLAARRGGGSMAQAIEADQHLDDIPGTLREAVAAFERELIGKPFKPMKAAWTRLPRRLASDVAR